MPAVASGLQLDPERRAVDDALEAVDDGGFRREGERPLVDAPERLEKHGRLHRARRVHRRRGVPLHRHARLKVLHDDSERRLPLGGERVEGLPERGGLCRRQAGGAGGAGERGEAPGVAERGAPAARSSKGVSFVDGTPYCVAWTTSPPVQKPTWSIFSSVPKKTRSPGARSSTPDRDELGVAEAHLGAVPHQEDPVPFEDAPDEAGAVEAPGRRPAPGVGRAEESAGHREPGGGVEERRSLARSARERRRRRRRSPFRPSGRRTSRHSCFSASSVRRPPSRAPIGAVVTGTDFSKLGSR